MPQCDVRDFGAVGDGDTDDSQALRAAIEAAGVGGTVLFSTGHYLFSETLVPAAHQRWVGQAAHMSGGAAPGSVLDYTEASGNGIEFAGVMAFESLTYQNSALTYTDATFEVSGSAAVGLAISGDVVAINCHFREWHTVFSFDTSSYTRFFACDFSRCGTALRATGQIFDVELHGTTSRYVNHVAVGSGGNQFENFKMLGGSVELYTSAFDDLVDSSFFGTYFETTYAGACAFFSTGAPSDVSLHLYGCKIFLNHHDRFVDLSGLSDGTFVSIGNQLEVGTTKAKSGQGQRYVLPGAANGGRMIMQGDTLHGRGVVGVDQMDYLVGYHGREHDLIVFPHNDPRIPAGVHAFVPLPKVVTLESSDTPSVAYGVTLARTGGPTTITHFDDGVVGQRLTILADHPVTVRSGRSLLLAGGDSFAMRAGDTLTLCMFRDQIWHEVARTASAVPGSWTADQFSC